MDHLIKDRSNRLDRDLEDSTTSLLVQSRLCTDLQVRLAQATEANKLLLESSQSGTAGPQLMPPAQYGGEGSSPSGPHKRPFEVSREEIDALKTKFRKKDLGQRVMISALR